MAKHKACGDKTCERFENPESVDLNSKQILMCHWWSSLLVKVKIHNSIDGANDVPGYFYLNWVIFVKWNAFNLTSAMSNYICLGFNVLWWHHAVDMPSTVRWMDVNSLTDLMTDVSSLIRWQIYSHHHLHPEIFTLTLVDSTHIVGHFHVFYVLYWITGV